jgi:hypothetical protein
MDDSPEYRGWPGCGCCWRRSNLSRRCIGTIEVNTSDPIWRTILPAVRLVSVALT